MFRTLQLLFNLEKSKTDLMKNILKQAFHWKAIVFTLKRIKTGFKFADILNCICSVAINKSKAETALYCAFVKSHLFISRTRTDDDASEKKTISRRLDQWIKWDIDSLFLEATISQETIKRTKAKNNLLLNTKKYVTLEVLLKKRKVVSFLNDKTDSKTVHDVLLKKYLEIRKANLN